MRWTGNHCFLLDDDSTLPAGPNHRRPSLIDCRSCIFSKTLYTQPVTQLDELLIIDTDTLIFQQGGKKSLHSPVCERTSFFSDCPLIPGWRHSDASIDPIRAIRFCIIHRASQRFECQERQEGNDRWQTRRGGGCLKHFILSFLLLDGWKGGGGHATHWSGVFPLFLSTNATPRRIPHGTINNFEAPSLIDVFH